MRTLSTIFFAAILLASTSTASAENNNNLMFNTVTRNGITVRKNVYENHQGLLRNHTLTTYKYDGTSRIQETETRRWIKDAGAWEKAVLLRYEYKEGATTVYTYGWNKDSGRYELTEKMTLEN